MSESTDAPSRPLKSSTSRGTTGDQTGIKATSPQTEEFVIRRDAATGDVAGIEVVDETGKRVEIPSEKIQKIVGEDEIAEISTALDAAYDAGATMLLEEIVGEEDEYDTERTGSTVRQLMTAREKLIRRLFLRRLIRRYVLKQRTAVYKS